MCVNVTYRVDEEERIRQNVEHRLKSVLDLLVSRNTGRMDIINTRTNLIGVAVVFESVEQFHVTLGGLDGDDVSIQTLDGGENIIEVRVTEMRVGLKLISDAGGCELEGVYSPLEIGIPISATERELQSVNTPILKAGNIRDSHPRE